MLISSDAIPQSPCALPDLTITDPDKKNRAWILQYGRGFLTLYGNSGSVDFYRGRAKYQRAEDYANGDNVVKSALKRKSTTNDGEANPDRIDFRPLPLMHKPLMSVEGLLKDHSYEATVTPVDPVSLDERASYEGKMRAWMKHQEFLQSLGNEQPGGPGADIPLDEDDLALHMEVNYKIRDAIDLEQKIAYGMYLADYGRQDQQCTRDETVKGVSVLYMKRSGPRRLPVRLDPGDCFILPARSEDFPNLQAGAHLERVSLGQVLAEIEADPDTSLSAPQRSTLETLAKQSQDGSTFNSNYYLDEALGSQPELAGQLTVVRFSFVSTDLEVQKEYTNKFGNKQIRPMEASYGGPRENNPGPAKDMKIHRKPVQNWYEGTLILGTDIGYGCRRAYEQLRDEDNPFNTLPLYIVNAPGMMGKKIKSMVERCMIAVDIAARAIVKLQHAEAKWPDVAVKFNMTALQEAATQGGTGGKTMTRKEVLSFFIAEGIVVGNDYDDEGNQLGAAVQFIETPLLNAATRHWNTIQNSKNEIADITGINGVVSGADPASREGEGVREQAITGSLNALNHLFVAKHSRFERVAKSIAASVKAGEDKGRAPLAGPMQVTTQRGTKKAVYVKPNPGIAQRQWQTKITQKPTQQMWDRFYASIDKAVDRDQITAGDVAFLMEIDNLKQARYLLDVRTKRNAQQKMQEAATGSENQGKQAAMATEAAGKVEAEATKQKHENKMAEINLTKEWEFKIAKVQAGQQASNAAMAQDAKLQAQDMQHGHEAAMAQQQQDVDLMQHDAELTSSENDAEAARQHELELAAAQPAPVAA